MQITRLYFNKLRIKIFESLKDVFSKKPSSKPVAVLIVDLSAGIRMIDVGFKEAIRVNAVKTAGLPAENREKAIQEAITDFIAENDITHKNVILRPALKTLLIKRLQMPVVPASELTQAIKWQIKDDAKFDISAAVLDYRIIRRTTKSDGTEALDIICAAAAEEEIKKEVAVFKQIGLSCLSVNFLAFGYAEIIGKFIGKEADEVIAVLHLDDDICYIGFYQNDKFDFYRELPVSINKFRQALSSELVTPDKGRVKLASEEIEDILFKSGIPLGDTKYRDKLSSGQIMALLRPCLEELVQEIKRSYVYYDYQFKQGQVRKLFIDSKAARMTNLADVLKNGFALDVSEFPFIADFELSAKVDKKNFTEYYAALGMAVDFENNINLLPQEFKSEKIEMLERVSLRWVAFAACLLLSVSFFFAKASSAGFQRRLDNALLHLSVLAQVKETKEKSDKINRFIKDIRKQDDPLGDILKKFSSIVPGLLYFDALRIDCEAKTGKITGYIKSSGRNPDTVLTDFIDAMNDSYIFKDVNVSAVEKTSYDQGNISRFQITFSLS